MTDKLCPFCGSELEISEFANECKRGFKHYYAPCCKNVKCIAHNDTGEYCPIMYDTFKEARTAWNTRPLEDKLTARIAELEAENAILREQQLCDETDEETQNEGGEDFGGYGRHGGPVKQKRW